MSKPINKDIHADLGTTKDAGNFHYVMVGLFCLLCALTGLEMKRFVWRGNALCRELSYADDVLDETTEVLFVGASHVFQGVDPSRFSMNTRNLGYGCANLSISKLLIEQHLDRLESLKLLVLQCEDWSFNIHSLQTQRYNYVPLVDQCVSVHDLDLPVARKLEAVARVTLRIDYPACTPQNWWKRRMLRSQWRGVEGFVPPATDLPLSKPHASSALFFPDDRTVDGDQADPREVEALKSIIKVCRHKGVRVVLVRFPHTERFEALADSGLWRTQTELLFRQGQIRADDLWDFYGDKILAFSDDEFIDDHHLSPESIPRLCERLNAMVCFATGCDEAGGQSALGEHQLAVD